MKYNKYICIIASALMFASCDSFLSNESPSAMDAEMVFSSVNNTEQAIFGVYNLMGSNNSYRNRMACGFNGLNTDIEYSTKSTSSSDEKDLMLYDCTVSNSRVSNPNGSDIWSYLNTMIERCNNIIEGLEQYGKIQENEEMKAFLGEAYFLRSFAYLEQVKYWGDVPARFVSIAKDEKGVAAEKADRNLIFEQLRKDLKLAAEYLPWSQERKGAAANNVGRANKAAALALLARADLMYAGKAVRPLSLKDPVAYKVRYNIEDDANLRQEVYKEALEACAEIIKNEDYKLASDFAKPFKQICSDVVSYKDMEHIWVMPFADGARGQVLNYNAPKLSSDAQSAVNGHLPHYAGGSSNGHICVSPTLVYAYDKDDKRRYVTFVTGQWEYNNGDGESSSDSARIYIFPEDTTGNADKLYQKHVQISNFYLGKYRYEWMAEGRALEGTDDGVDFPVIRYADVLLMFAEASIGGISNDKPANNTGLDPLAQVNKLRNRAGVTPLSTLNMENIMQERAFELCGEYVRKYDLMRWGNLKEKMVETQNTIRKMAAPETRSELSIGDSIYYKYRYDAEIGGYVMDSIWGLYPGQNTRPATFSKVNGWQAKDLFQSESKGYILSENNYPIFVSEEKLESRQYWPIFSTNIAASNGTLWNNYGY